MAPVLDGGGAAQLTGPGEVEVKADVAVLKLAPAGASADCTIEIGLPKASISTVAPEMSKPKTGDAKLKAGSQPKAPATTGPADTKGQETKTKNADAKKPKAEPPAPAPEKTTAPTTLEAPAGGFTITVSIGPDGVTTLWSGDARVSGGFGAPIKGLKSGQLVKPGGGRPASACVTKLVIGPDEGGKRTISVTALPANTGSAPLISVGGNLVQKGPGSGKTIQLKQGDTILLRPAGAGSGWSVTIEGLIG